MFQDTRLNKRFCAVVMVDVDFFKSINDSYDHDVGDYVLASIAAIMKDAIRNVDILARMGGEESVILLPDAYPNHAIDIADRLRKTIEDSIFIGNEGDEFKATISCGLSFYNESYNFLEQIVKVADNMLYMSKGNGRNRVTY